MKKLLTYLSLFFSFYTHAQLNQGLVENWPLDGSITFKQSATDGDYRTQGLNMDVDRGNKVCAAEMSKYGFSIYYSTNVVTERSLSLWLKRHTDASGYIFESPSFPLIKRVGDSLQIDLFQYNNKGKKFYLIQDHWHHIVWTYKDGNNKVYFDGVFQYGNTSTQSFQTNSNFLFNGVGSSFDDMRIYQRELTSADVTALYSLPSSCLTTALEADESLNATKTMVYAVDIMGKRIENLAHFSGICIISYSDGSKKKVLK